MMVMMIRLDPAETQFHNNLGVTLMRLSKYEQAYQEFQLAIKLDPLSSELILSSLLSSLLLSCSSHPTTDDARSNLRELDKYYKSPTKSRPLESEEELRDRERLRLKPRKKQPPFPRIHISALYDAENAAYAAGTKPFILTGAMDSWNIQHLWTLSDLTTRFRDSIVDFYPYNMYQKDNKPYLITLENAISVSHIEIASCSCWSV